jgi:hypothetical protein
MVRAALGLAGTDEYAVNGVTLTTKHVRGLISGVRKAPEVASQVWEDTRSNNEGSLPEQALRESYARVLAPVAETTTENSEDSNSSFDSSDRSEESNAPTNQDRWQVNERLRSLRKALERLQEDCDQVTKGGLAPLDAEQAEREVTQIRALGRWFDRHAAVPTEIMDAEVVEG